MVRVLFTRTEEDGTVTDGTVELTLTSVGYKVSDFRALDGTPLPLGPGDELEFRVEAPPEHD